MRGTEFAELRAFAEVADRRSFARAAEHLRVAPSTLSQTIRSLEERLGVVLLNRTTRRVSLTSAGDRLLSRFAPAMKELEAAVLDAHEGRTQPRGVVRLHAPRPAYARHVAPVLGSLRHELPDVVLDLSVDDSPVEASTTGYDLVIRRGASIDGSWETLSLGAELRHAVVAAPAYLAESETPTCPDDLSEHRCIRWRPIGSDTQAWQFECDRQPQDHRGLGSARRLSLRRGHHRGAPGCRHRLRPRVLLADLHGRRAVGPAAVPVSSSFRWVEGMLFEKHPSLPRRARRRRGAHDRRAAAGMIPPVTNATGPQNDAWRREPMPRIEPAALLHACRDPAACRTTAHIPW